MTMKNILRDKKCHIKNYDNPVYLSKCETREKEEVYDLLIEAEHSLPDLMTIIHVSWEKVKFLALSVLSLINYNYHYHMISPNFILTSLKPRITIILYKASSSKYHFSISKIYQMSKCFSSYIR